MIQTDALSRTSARRLEPLFQPVRIGDLTLKNRIAMAPMTRAMSPDGVPREDVARYYRRRAEVALASSSLRALSSRTGARGMIETHPASMAKRRLRAGAMSFRRCMQLAERSSRSFGMWDLFASRG